MNGIIVKAISGFYYISDGEKVYECKARGSFRVSGVSPLVGDRAEFRKTEEGKGIVAKVETRKNMLSRPPVANIDKLFIISSYEKPSPNAYIIDKLAALAEYKGIEPIIVFNKCDMGGFEEWEEIYRRADFKVFTVSAENGEGIKSLRGELKDSVSAFTGNSGVGKSSILNNLFSDLKLETGAVSDKLGRGRHTTRHTELFPLPEGGFVADTPGFSSLEAECNDYEFKERLIYCFRDLKQYADGCRFTDCTHTVEKGCNVIKAVEKGEIAESRHKSYTALFEELKDLKPWNAAKNKLK